MEANTNTRRKELDATWQDWLKTNLERKCDALELVEILVKNGFDLFSIRKHMGDEFPTVRLLDNSKPDYKAIANVRLTRGGLVSNAVKVPTDRVQLYTLENFMSEVECDQIVELTAQHLRRSTVTTGDIKYRTSSTSDLSLIEEPEIVALEEKIASTLGIRLPFSEPIQAQRYDVGQEFKKHTDYFQPNSQEYATYAGRAGQRTWTFMVYLCNCTAGGGTRFWELEKTFLPRKGMAVIWNNLHQDGTPNPATLHSGQPVEAGQKIIITKWFRDRGTGPMFY